VNRNKVEEEEEEGREEEDRGGPRGGGPGVRGANQLSRGPQLLRPPPTEREREPHFVFPANGPPGRKRPLIGLCPVRRHAPDWSASTAIISTGFTEMMSVIKHKAPHRQAPKFFIDKHQGSRRDRRQARIRDPDWPSGPCAPQGQGPLCVARRAAHNMSQVGRRRVICVLVYSLGSTPFSRAMAQNAAVALKDASLVNKSLHPPPPPR
jgi:hypothetical protein